MRALSDFLPSLSAQAGRSFWVPEEVLSDVQAAARSLRTAFDGETLLEASLSSMLIHIGPGSAARAINYIHGRQGGQAILFHPGKQVRDIQQAIYADHPAIRVAQNLDALALPTGATVNVFIDESCFDIQLVKSIAAQVEIDWLVGAFESSRFPTLHLYKQLKDLAKHFRLRDISINSLVHGGPSDVIDISIIAAVSADKVSEYDLALAGEWTLNRQVQLLPEALEAADHNVLQHLATHIPDVALLHNGQTLEQGFRTALSLAKGRYTALLPPGIVPDKMLLEQMFTAAIAANADMVLATAEPVLADLQLQLGTQHLDQNKMPDAIARTAAVIFRTDFLNFYDLSLDPTGGKAALTALAGAAAMAGAQVARIHMPAQSLRALDPAEHRWLVNILTARAERTNRAADKALTSAISMSMLACREVQGQGSAADAASNASSSPN